MKITVIGATGMVGSRITAEAAARGHEVIAVARHTRREDFRTSSELITPVSADAHDPTALDQVLSGAEAVVLAARAVPGGADEFVVLTRTVLNATARARNRLLIIGGAGPLRSPEPSAPELTAIDDARFVPPEWRSVAAASVAQLEECTAHASENWTYLSPPAVLTPGERTGEYRRGTTTLLTDDNGVSRISAEDLAVAVIDELENSQGLQRFTIAY